MDPPPRPSKHRWASGATFHGLRASQRLLSSCFGGLGEVFRHQIDEGDRGTGEPEASGYGGAVDQPCRDRSMINFTIFLAFRQLWRLAIRYQCSAFLSIIFFLLPPQPGLGAGRPGECPAPAKACDYRKWVFSKVIT